jgi:hypothetical protein
VRREEGSYAIAMRPSLAVANQLGADVINILESFPNSLEVFEGHNQPCVGVTIDIMKPYQVESLSSIKYIKSIQSSNCQA